MLANIEQIAGIARSLFVYYSLPGRAARRQHFYRTVVQAGDLCFDIGAHVGNHTRDLLAVGARIISVEPQPALMRVLHWLYGRHPNVALRQVAVGAERRRARLLTSRLSPTMATLSPDWIATVKQADGFQAVAWESFVEVAVVTLDDLIAQYGKPTFCKLDIEGYEVAALHGLSVPLPLVAFEFIPAACEEAVACVQRLMELGSYTFNWSVGEKLHLQETAWVDDDRIVQQLRSFNINDRSGDVYARLLADQAFVTGGGLQ